MERRHFLKARWWCGHKRHGTCLDCECCAIIIRLAATRIRCPRRRGCRTGSRYAGRPRSSQAGAGPLAPSLAPAMTLAPASLAPAMTLAPALGLAAAPLAVSPLAPSPLVGRSVSVTSLWRYRAAMLFA